MLPFIVGNYIIGLMVVLTICLICMAEKQNLSKNMFLYIVSFPLWGGFSLLWFTGTAIWYSCKYLYSQYKINK